MVKRSISITFKLLMALIAISALGLIISRLVTMMSSWSQIFPPEQAPYRRVAIVFGAGLRRDGTPTPVLRDRVDAAASLYLSGKVEKILMSGGEHSPQYSEPIAMRDYAISMGVPPAAIVTDSGGHNTYETCYRASAIFKITDAVLVTQSFHLPRALYTCNALGIKAIGVPADRRVYRQVSHLVWNIRELPATVKAFWDVHFSHPTPASGYAEPIFPYEAQ
jgi:SanA protein